MRVLTSVEWNRPSSRMDLIARSPRRLSVNVLRSDPLKLRGEAAAAPVVDDDVITLAADAEASWEMASLKDDRVNQGWLRNAAGESRRRR